MATASENRLTDYQATGAMDFLHQASAEHFQQSAEFPPLRNRALGPLAVTVLPIPLARRASMNGSRVAATNSASLEWTSRFARDLSLLMASDDTKPSGREA